MWMVRTMTNPALVFDDRPLHRVFSTFRKLATACLSEPPCGTKVLYPPDHPAIPSELVARQHKLEKQMEKQKEKEKKQGASAPSGESWVEAHMQFAGLHKIRYGSGAGSGLLENPWFKTLSPREQDMLPVLQAQNATTIFRDLSQSIGRANSNSLQVSGKHLFPTMLPKQQLWIEQGRHSRFLLGQEALLLQGFPAEQFLEWLQAKQEKQGLRPGSGKNDAWWPSESLMQDLAGNAMALPVVLTLLQCAFCAVSWRERIATASETPLAADKVHPRSDC